MSDSTPKPFAFTEQAAARDAEDARRRARRAIADTCGPEDAHTVPFDTGRVHGPVDAPTDYLHALADGPVDPDALFGGDA